MAVDLMREVDRLAIEIDGGQHPGEDGERLTGPQSHPAISARTCGSRPMRPASRALST